MASDFPGTDNAPMAIGAILYPGFEMLDLFGPLEMFSLVGDDRVTIHMLAGEPGPIPAAMGNALDAGPRVLADCAFADAPPLDILLVPGGVGTFPALEDRCLLDFLSERAASARVTASVCTGAALLAKAGLLNGHRATTNKQYFALVAGQSDTTEWVEKARWVDEGDIATASGVSAGMDMAVALIARLFGEPVAGQVRAAAEYTWHADADDDPFFTELNKGMDAPGAAT